MKNPYLLLTPGPLSTTETVRNAMGVDHCTWDEEYKELTQDVRSRLVALGGSEEYTAILMQGSGTFVVEATIGSVLPRKNAKLLIAANGVYGQRIAEIAEILAIPTQLLDMGEVNQITVEAVEEQLKSDATITHIAVVHCETTTGILNPVAEICQLAKRYQKVTIVDAMSSFGGVPLNLKTAKIDFLISSANKCIQGVPGFGFVLAKKDQVAGLANNARSLSLDLFDQLETMDQTNGKWRFTSPTHVLHAFHQALLELEQEGGITNRYQRYSANQKRLSQGMELAGFPLLLKPEQQSPIITSFCYPTTTFSFTEFYEQLKERGFVIYPGKISKEATFRIGTIGDVNEADIEEFLEAVHQIMKT
ncbi:2-aminoethylphosphonate--pyruvate transaminase [Carnobacterium gallinarum]|uniref:2-aminoethylphosphonate--pyruvate transaminase n=1 Tax=Carnobacterium gallinarum TaxID=2749 RepID=UPI000B19ED61